MEQDRTPQQNADDQGHLTDQTPDSTEDSADDTAALTPRQLAALPYLVASPTISQGARLARVGSTTLYRWMADDLFRSRLKKLRSEAEELAQTELRGLMLKGALVLAELLEDPTPAVRLRAAQASISAGLRNGEIREFQRRLDRVDDALVLRLSHQPIR